MEGSNGIDAHKRMAELGRLLASAEGYQVLTTTGSRLGRVDHVRYQQHADRPDEIVVRSRRLLWTRRRAYPLSAVRDVNRSERTLVIGPFGGSPPIDQPELGVRPAPPEH